MDGLTFLYKPTEFQTESSAILPIDKTDSPCGNKKIVKDEKTEWVSTGKKVALSTACIGILGIVAKSIWSWSNDPIIPINNPFFPPAPVISTPTSVEPFISTEALVGIAAAIVTAVTVHFDVKWTNAAQLQLPQPAPAIKLDAVPKVKINEKQRMLSFLIDLVRPKELSIHIDEDFEKRLREEIPKEITCLIQRWKGDKNKINEFTSNFINEYPYPQDNPFSTIVVEKVIEHYLKNNYFEDALDIILICQQSEYGKKEPDFFIPHLKKLYVAYDMHLKSSLDLESNETKYIEILNKLFAINQLIYEHPKYQDEFNGYLLNNLKIFSMDSNYRNLAQEKLLVHLNQHVRFQKKLSIIYDFYQSVGLKIEKHYLNDILKVCLDDNVYKYLLSFTIFKKEIIDKYADDIIQGYKEEFKKLNGNKDFHHFLSFINLLFKDKHPNAVKYITEDLSKLIIDDNDFVIPAKDAVMEQISRFQDIIESNLSYIEVTEAQENLDEIVDYYVYSHRCPNKSLSQAVGVHFFNDLINDEFDFDPELALCCVRYKGNEADNIARKCFCKMISPSTFEATCDGVDFLNSCLEISHGNSSLSSSLKYAISKMTNILYQEPDENKQMIIFNKIIEIVRSKFLNRFDLDNFIFGGLPKIAIACFKNKKIVASAIMIFVEFINKKYYPPSDRSLDCIYQSYKHESGDGYKIIIESCLYLFFASRDPDAVEKTIFYYNNFVVNSNRVIVWEIFEKIHNVFPIQALDLLHGCLKFEQSFLQNINNEIITQFIDSVIDYLKSKDNDLDEEDLESISKFMEISEYLNGSIEIREKIEHFFTNDLMSLLKPDSNIKFQKRLSLGWQVK